MADRGASTQGIKTRKVPKAGKIRIKELPVFTRQLSAMLESGMPLVQVLVALEEQTDEPHFKKVIGTVRMKVEGGSMYSDALKMYPSIFSELYVSMMRAGETGGILADVAARVAGFLESSNKLRRKVKSSMMYPLVVICVAIILATALIMFVLPTFASMFADFGQGLPGPTQFLLDLSDWLRANGLIVLGALVGLGFAFRRFAATERGGYIVDLAKLRFPILGELARKLSVSRFSSTFAQLLHSGVPILQALDIVGVATGNKVIGRTIIHARGVVEGGDTLSSALAQNPYFPRMAIHMLSAGEQTGKIDDMMDRLSRFYEEEVEAMLEGLTSMIEPLLMVFIGTVIGGIVICMFLPIFKMSEVVSM
ncbi:type II secretion system F family protein [Kiritimatiella glycovorans]|uniref:General secretion pathway protein F n=1 Tax=Kiritimatiella glycovorans TaxID=1307763 RepID=A0A0G3EHB1_9BACT|nr:type II secretion system F family protein [Kiritimatiella glycovorans]AKJ63549.1 General secretion pathway protein F [Kiritimatiella glycovorans]